MLLLADDKNLYFKLFTFAKLVGVFQ